MKIYKSLMRIISIIIIILCSLLIMVSPKPAFVTQTESNIITLFFYGSVIVLNIIGFRMMNSIDNKKVNKGVFIAILIPIILLVAGSFLTSFIK